MSSGSQPSPSLPPDPTPSQPPPEESPSVPPSGSDPPPTQSDPPPPSGSQSEPSGSPSAPPTNSESQPTGDPSTPPPNVPSPSSNPSETLSAVLTTDANGGVVTITKVMTRSSLPSASESASGGGSTSFFDNKGAMAGTFTVVGLVALGLIFVVVTWSIRRRRAKQFDRDVAEAAREAAHANPPTFLDDPADDGDRSYATQNYVYSDNSHGTFAQPPMDHYPQEVYNMGEINHNYPSAGAAGVGVMRARSRRELDDSATAGMAGYGAGGGFHGGFGENQSPYPVFAAPGAYQPHDAMYDNRYPGMHDHGHGDLVTAAAPIAAATTAAAANQQPSHTLARQKSQGGRSLVDGYHGANELPAPPESYASRYQPGYKPDPTQYPLPPPADMPHTSAPAARSSMYRDDDDPYGGYSSPGHHAGEHPNNRQSALDDSDDDSEDRHDTRRVLKVANE